MKWLRNKIIAHRWKRAVHSDEFRHGIDLGESLGAHKLYQHTVKHHDAGLITTLEEWLEWQRPKTMEDWDAFWDDHPELKRSDDRLAEKDSAEGADHGPQE